MVGPLRILTGGRLTSWRLTDFKSGALTTRPHFLLQILRSDGWIYRGYHMPARGHGFYLRVFSVRCAHSLDIELNNEYPNARLLKLQNGPIYYWVQLK